MIWWKEVLERHGPYGDRHRQLYGMTHSRWKHPHLDKIELKYRKLYRLVLQVEVLYGVTHCVTLKIMFAKLIFYHK